jgi:hypothetical protein
MLVSTDDELDIDLIIDIVIVYRPTKTLVRSLYEACLDV